MEAIFTRVYVYDKDTNKIKANFPYADSIVITEDRNQFTNTATVTVSHRIKTKNLAVTDIFKIQDRIAIWMGYFDDTVVGFGLKLEFEGYISSINPNSPLIFECQDQAFLYKLEQVGALRQTNTTLSKLLKAIYKGKTLFMDAKIGTWSVDKNATLLNVLDELKQKLGFVSYWRNGILHVNAETLLQPEKTILLDTHKNVPLDSNTLLIKKNSDQKTISYGISKQSGGTKNEAWCYYRDLSNTDIIVSKTAVNGVVSKMTLPSNLSFEYVSELAKRRLPNIDYTGVDGTIKTFGAPSVHIGDYVAIKDNDNKDLTAVYKIESITKGFSADGYFQTIKPSKKVRNF